MDNSKCESHRRKLGREDRSEETVVNRTGEVLFIKLSSGKLHIDITWAVASRRHAVTFIASAQRSEGSCGDAAGVRPDLSPGVTHIECLNENSFRSRERRFKTDPPQMCAAEYTTNDELMKYTCPLLAKQTEKQTPVTNLLRMIENVFKENELMNSQSFIYSDRFKRKHRKSSNRL
ncbi:hypothetical protein CBL_08566 [Carabus blaptoides fortunei]